MSFVYHLFILYIVFNSILTSGEAGFNSRAKLAGWLRMEVPLTLVFFCFPLCRIVFFPIVFMALGHRTAPLGSPKYQKNTGFPRSLTDGYPMLLSSSKGVTAVYSYHCPRDMAVRRREVMARLWVGACVPFALSLHYFQGDFR